MERIFTLFLLTLVFPSFSMAQSLVIHDHAKLLSENSAADASKRLEKYLNYMAAEFDIDLQVYTTRSHEDINLLANDLFAKLNLGDRSKTGRGLLLVINPESNKVRLEVGYALEAVFTDAFVAYIERHQMVPFFGSQRVAEGVTATIELMITHLQANREGRAPPELPVLFGSGGGGAVVDAGIGSKKNVIANQTPSPQVQQILHRFTPQSSPFDVYILSIELARLRVHDWTFPFHTAGTREHMNHAATIAQIDNSVRTHERCGKMTAQTDGSGRFAVLRYPTRQRLCPPYFLMREKGYWRLDFLAMSYGLRMDFSNQWYVAGSLAQNPFIQPYLFAFPDWYSDSNGKLYPLRWHFTLDTSKKCDTPLRITSVTPEMPAATLGLRAGDRPVRVNGERVSDPCRFMAIMRRTVPNSPISVAVAREEEIVELKGTAPAAIGNMPIADSAIRESVVNDWKRRVQEEYPQIRFQISSRH